jgi:hypothetical protein
MYQLKPESISRSILAISIAYICYFVGVIVAPLLYPYKMFLSDTWAEIASIQFRSLGRPETYVGSYAVQGYIGLAVIFSVVYFIIKWRIYWHLVIYFFFLGIYYGIMLNGAVAGHLHASFDDAMRPRLQVLTQLPLYLALPVFLILVLPLLVAYTASRIERSLKARKSKE